MRPNGSITLSIGILADACKKYKEYFPRQNPISMEKVINGYVRSVKGKGNGEIIRIYNET